MYVQNTSSSEEHTEIQKTLGDIDTDVKDIKSFITESELQELLSKIADHSTQDSFEGFYEILTDNYQPSELDSISIQALDIGNTLRYNGKYNHAIPQYDLVLSKFPNNLEALMGKSLALMGLGKNAEALELANKISVIQQYYRGVLLEKEGLDAEAKEAYLQAHAMDPFNTIIFVAIGSLLLDTDKWEDGYEESIQWFDKALEIDPNNFIAREKKLSVLEYLGIINHNEKNFQTALDYFERAIEFSSESIFSWRWGSTTLYYMERYDEAVRWCDKSLEIDPDDGTCLIIKGLALRDLGKFNEAISVFDIGIKKYPDAAGFLYHKSGSLYLSGNLSGALFYVDKAISIYPEYVVAVQFRELLVNLME